MPDVPTFVPLLFEWQSIEKCSLVIRSSAAELITCSPPPTCATCRYRQCPVAGQHLSLWWSLCCWPLSARRKRAIRFRTCRLPMHRPRQRKLTVARTNRITTKVSSSDACPISLAPPLLTIIKLDTHSIRRFVWLRVSGYAPFITGSIDQLMSAITKTGKKRWACRQADPVGGSNSLFFLGGGKYG